MCCFVFTPRQSIITCFKKCGKIVDKSGVLCQIYLLFVARATHKMLLMLRIEFPHLHKVKRDTDRSDLSPHDNQQTYL
jgi:hypothetical protein